MMVHHRIRVLLDLKHYCVHVSVCVCVCPDLVMMLDDGDEVDMEGSSSFKESGGGEDGADFLLVWTETTWARTTHTW